MNSILLNADSGSAQLEFFVVSESSHLDGAFRCLILASLDKSIRQQLVEALHSTPVVAY